MKYYLLGNIDIRNLSDVKPVDMVVLPILSDIKAGRPLFAEQHFQGEMLFPKQLFTSGFEHFLLKVEGDSMIGDDIMPGDIVLIRVQDYIDKEGQIAAVIINGEEACLKHVYHPVGSNMIILRSSNPVYADIVHPVNDVIINGVYAGVFKAPKNNNYEGGFMLKNIPGFRSGQRYKKIIAIIGYSMIAIFLLLMWVATNGTIVDKSIVLFQVLFLLSVPFILLTNFLGIRRYIPLVNSKNFFKLGIGFVVSFVIWFSLFGLLIYSMDGLHTPEYKADVAMRREQRAQEQRAKEQRAAQKAAAEAAKNTKISQSSDSDPNSAPVSTPAPSSASNAPASLSSEETPASTSPQEPIISSPPEKSLEPPASPVSSVDTSVPSSSSNKTEPKTQEKEDSSSSTNSNDAEPVFEAIAGMAAVDIKLNLENWGIPEAKPQSSEAYDGVLYESSASDPDTGVELGYSIMADNSLNVISVTFRALNLNAASKKDFLSVATGFLGYCATVPYDTANPQKAKQWIIDNINQADTAGKVKTLVIGDAEFSLYGNGSGARFLEIKKAEPK